MTTRVRFTVHGCDWCDRMTAEDVAGISGCGNACLVKIGNPPRGDDDEMHYRWNVIRLTPDKAARLRDWLTAWLEEQEQEHGISNA